MPVGREVGFKRRRGVIGVHNYSTADLLPG